eukprot:14383894-Alexandrium_andersonii.AAC.1
MQFWADSFCIKAVLGVRPWVFSSTPKVRWALRPLSPLGWAREARLARSAQSAKCPADSSDFG